MIPGAVVSRALAVDLRQIDTGTLLGVALIVPSEQCVFWLADGTQRTVEPKLTAGLWREIDAWTAVGDAGLPARPAPLSAPVVAAILDGQYPSVSAHRFASIPLSAAVYAELAPLAGRMLPELLKARRSAA